jgi:hypoxanthine phosphoribosyltransferase
MHQQSHEPRRELITWEEVGRLIDHLIPQFRREFTAMVTITRGGLIPGGMLAEAMDITHILTAAVDFPAQESSEKAKLIAWPQFIQFPADDKLRGRPTLIVDDVWGSGRTITAVKIGLGGGRVPGNLCAALQSISQLVWAHTPGLFCSGH